MKKNGGLLVLNKPNRLTSFQIVREVRKKLKLTRVGHCGTLDPIATGILLILFGKATKYSESLMSKDKTYRAGMLLGIKTDTGDVTGKILQTSSPPSFSKKEIETTIKKFEGEMNQIPPMYSAIKWKGRKLYEYARRGINVERQPRSIHIYSIDLLEKERSYLNLRIKCSKGTYVRSLVEDIGDVLGIPATLTDLVRESSGDFSLARSISWDDFQKMNREDLLSRAQLIDSTLSHAV